MGVLTLIATSLDRIPFTHDGSGYGGYELPVTR